LYSEHIAAGAGAAARHPTSSPWWVPAMISRALAFFLRLWHQKIERIVDSSRRLPHGSNKYTSSTR
jgi:hypothetical protein